MTPLESINFTIVTPVFNGMPWLPEAINSVLSQRREADTELIVLDAGSTDGSREWLEREVGRDATLVFEPDTGQTDALIRGFQQARGLILGWLNADDLLEPRALATVADEIRASRSTVAVSGRCLWIDESGDVTGTIPTPPSSSLRGLLATPYNLPQPATFFRRDAYERVGGLDPRLTMAMDVDLWMKLAKLGEVRLTDRTLARFRIHEAAKSQAGAVTAVREDWAVRRRHGMPLLSSASRTLFRSAYVEPYVRWLKARAVRYEGLGTRRRR
jgi:glycosyltransferase involved in cell wall biosynthesis